mmetsp:Transcript_33894/g.74358  ORF Transcript_33894/g.74358 Transcript_33894/m.74358 type:complete len:226 (-) Transcript_33894:788-1465(-)
MVANGDHHFHLPEQGAGVAVVVIPEGDVFDDGIRHPATVGGTSGGRRRRRRQHVPNVNVEPRLVPAGEDVAPCLWRVGSVAEVGRHDDRLGLGEDEALDKGWEAMLMLRGSRGRGGSRGGRYCHSSASSSSVLLLLLLFDVFNLHAALISFLDDKAGIATGPSEAFNGVGLIVEGHVLNPNVLLAGDDADGNAKDEGQSAVAPGDAVEQVGVIVVGGGRYDGAVG